MEYNPNLYLLSGRGAVHAIAEFANFCGDERGRVCGYSWSLLFVFTIIFILVSHREGTRIKVKTMVKIRWNTTLIFIYYRED